MKKLSLFVLLFFSLFIFSCEDNEDIEPNASLDLTQSLIGTWLVDSSSEKVTIVPESEITILDPYNAGNGSITVTGEGINASLNYVIDMFSTMGYYGNYNYFRVSNYPKGSDWESDRVDYISYDNYVYLYDDLESYYFETISGSDNTFNSSSFTVSANHDISLATDYLSSWSSDDYQNNGSFQFYLSSPAQVTISLSVDGYPSEATYNFYLEGDYYFSTNQEFSYEYETKTYSIYLGSGYHYIYCYDSYGDGGIQGNVSIPGATIDISGTLTASTETVAAGVSKEIYSGESSNLQTMTFNSDGTVILSYNEDTIDDDELDLWYINESSELVIIDGDYDYGDGYTNINLKFLIEQDGEKTVITSSMEWCEYLDIQDESDCNQEYSNIEEQLMLSSNTLSSIQQVLEFNLIPLGSTPLIIGN